MGQLISASTQKNWERLGITATGVRLKSRANKTSSDRIVFPVEYFRDRKNVSCIRRIADYAAGHHIPAERILYAVSLRCLGEKGLIRDGRAMQSNVEAYTAEYRHLSSSFMDMDFDVPPSETDFLGLLYQCLKPEGKRNQDGMYYTASPVAEVLLRGLAFSGGQRFLDPCCGSGNLFLHLKVAEPRRLFGIDTDPVAVMIAKCNLIMKYAGTDFEPQIFQKDFLETDILFAGNTENPLGGVLFNYIVTNPPWGAVSNFDDADFAEIKSRESFAAFLFKSMKHLSEDGLLRFLLPESFLKIRTHSGIRSFILGHYSVEEIRSYAHSFSGVATGFIDVSIAKKRRKDSVIFSSPGKDVCVNASIFGKNKYSVFSLLTDEDNRIIGRAKSLGARSLRDSAFALGIVTGDNKAKLSEKPGEGLEPIYTGKEILPYCLLPPKYYIRFDKYHFQQAARESMYRAPEKLAYKFISGRLVFAYDNSGSLFLNSANILIPRIDGMHIKTVLAFLNSELFQFMYRKQFGDIKILKSNLVELPFPGIDAETDRTLCSLADSILSGDKAGIHEVDERIYDIYRLDKSERLYVKNALDG